VALIAGFLAAMASTLVVLVAWDRSPPVDGEFVLEEPGEFVEPAASVPVTGDFVSDLELIDERGEPITLVDFAGTPLVVNVWFSTCAPCAREVRDFAEVHAEVGDRVEFIGVNPLDDAETMLSFAEARDVEYRLLRDPTKAWVTDVPIGVYPTTLFVSPSGEILRQTTALDARELRDIITELFPPNT
jgi:peroxiredoxin